VREPCIEIERGRHPVVEARLSERGQAFMPNDCRLDAKRRKLGNGALRYEELIRLHIAPRLGNRWLDSLLGLCFCDHCMTGASKAGINSKRLRANVAVRVERHAAYMIGMAFQREQRLASFRVPDSNRPIMAGCGKTMAVVSESN
jgi:hypothetical protein